MFSLSKRGSSMVEAAIIFPIIILIFVSMVKCGLNLYLRAKDQSEKNFRGAIGQMQSEFLCDEEVLRGKWVLK